MKKYNRKRKTRKRRYLNLHKKSLKKSRRGGVKNQGKQRRSKTANKTRKNKIKRGGTMGRNNLRARTRKKMSKKEVAQLQATRIKNRRRLQKARAEGKKKILQNLQKITNTLGNVMRSGDNFEKWKKTEEYSSLPSAQKKQILKIWKDRKRAALDKLRDIAIRQDNERKREMMAAASKSSTASQKSSTTDTATTVRRFPTPPLSSSLC
jgi:hypothetical protein